VERADWKIVERRRNGTQIRQPRCQKQVTGRQGRRWRR